jgi:hypothetical protein
VPVALSKDQTNNNKIKIKKLQRKYPNKKIIIKNKKILKITVSRAFGDFG